jgi:hypothetical protein
MSAGAKEKGAGNRRHQTRFKVESAGTSGVRLGRLKAPYAHNLGRFIGADFVKRIKVRIRTLMRSSVASVPHTCHLGTDRGNAYEEVRCRPHPAPTLLMRYSLTAGYYCSFLASVAEYQGEVNQHQGSSQQVFQRNKHLRRPCLRSNISIANRRHGDGAEIDEIEIGVFPFLSYFLRTSVRQVPLSSLEFIKFALVFLILRNKTLV